MDEKKIIHEPSDANRRAELDRLRRKTDNIDELPEGFTLKPHGRDGVVYYREGERVLELSYEADGTSAGILLYLGGLDAWLLPSRRLTSPADRQRIRDALENWARNHRGRVSLVSSEDLIRPWET